jgi:hypothetical protein
MSRESSAKAAVRDSRTVTFTLRLKIGEISVCIERYRCLKKILSAKLIILIPAK